MPAAATAKRAISGRAFASAVKNSDFAALGQAIRAGISVKRLDELQRRSGLPWDGLFKVLRLPPRTLARRRKRGRLSVMESDRLVRIAELFERAVKLFDGDARSATSWFKAPNRTFAGATPLSVAETEIGANQVEQLLGRLEYGVFS
jgi:putative toxin-antitoxin system antitoxin component (TIGR02293 family)